MINSKRAHQAERSGCRSESEMLSFGASLRLVYITRQLRSCGVSMNIRFRKIFDISKCDIKKGRGGTEVYHIGSSSKAMERRVR